MKGLSVCLGALLAIWLGAAAAPAMAAGDKPPQATQTPDRCDNCPGARPKYDSTEVIKQTHDVDKSQVIETESVVPSKRVIETNHLVIHENETRNVGTVQHVHTIIDKEIIFRKRNVDHVYVNTEVNLVKHKYVTKHVRVVEEHEVPGEVRYLRNCRCRPKAMRSYGRAPRYVRLRN